MAYPNTGTVFDVSRDKGNTQSGLSTQIIIKVGITPIGALQELTVAQQRPLQRLYEVGTDGTIEIVPNGATTYELTARRLVFDNLRLPEAFSRGFRFIAAQRVPFDIEIIDTSNLDVPNSEISDGASGLVSMTYKNCWFQAYGTPYAAENYVITETATIWAETAFTTTPDITTDRQLETETDNQAIESLVNKCDRRGSFDATGLLNSIIA